MARLNLIAALDRAGVVALARHRHLDRAGVGGVALVGKLVVAALDKLGVATLDHGRLLLLAAVVLGVLELADRELLGVDRQGTEVLGRHVVVGLLGGTVPRERVVVRGLAGFGLGARHLEVDRLALDETLELTAGCQCGTVIGLLGALGRDLEVALLDSEADGPAVGIFKPHVGEVLGAVPQARPGNRLRVGAGIGTAHALGARVLYVRHVIERVVTRERHLGGGLLIAVVGGLLSRSVHLHHHFVRNGLNRKRALDLGDVVVLGVGVTLQRVGKRVGARSGIELGAGARGARKTLRSHKALTAHRDLILGECGAVVRLLGRAGCQRHRTPRNGERTIGHDELDVAVGIVLIGELALTAVLIDTGVLVAHGGAVKLDIIGRVTLGARDARNGITVHLVVLAIVGDGVALHLDVDDNLLGVLCNRERTVLDRDLVVLVDVLGLAVRKGVIGRADLGLRAGIGDGRLIGTKEALGRNLVHSQRRAVIRLGRSSRGDACLLLGNGKRTVLSLDLELARHVVAGGIGHLGSSRNLVRVLTGVMPGHALGFQAGDMERNALDLKGILLKTAQCLLMSIVFTLVALGLDGQLELLVVSALVDREFAIDLGDLVVIRVGILLERVVERVRVLAREDVVVVIPGVVLADVLALGKTVARDGHAAAGQGLAIILLVAGIGRQRHLALLDRQFAILLDDEPYVAEVLIGVAEILGLEAHGVLAGVGTLGGSLAGIHDATLYI